MCSDLFFIRLELQTDTMMNGMCYMLRWDFLLVKLLNKIYV